LRTDNAFVTFTLKAWCLLHHVILSPCIPHEHFQIGLVERFHRTLEDSNVKCISSKPHLSMQYWGFAYNDIILKSNILPIVHRPTTTPYELWHGSKLDLKDTQMLPFGSVVMAHIPLALQRSLGPRSVETFVVGCSLAHVGGLLLYNPVTKRVIIRRSYKTLGPTRPPNFTYTFLLDDASLVPVSSSVVDSTSTISAQNITPHVSGVLSSVDFRLPPLLSVPESLPLSFPVTESSQSSLPVTDSSAYVSRRTHVCRTYHPKRLSVVSNVSQRCLRAALRARLAAIHEASFMNAPIPDFIAPPPLLSIPRTYGELLHMPLGKERTGYLEAVRSEMASMASMQAFSGVPVSLADVPRSKIISSKFIFDAKYNPDGTFQKYKCRLVARGDRWIDHYSTKTFAGTVKSESVGLLLSICGT
jgi:hypothetical protein